MSLSIYKFSAQYITRASLPGQVECTSTPNLFQKVWGSNPLRSKRKRHCCDTIAHWLHCSAFDFRWPHWPCDISGKIDDLSPKSLISWDLSRNTVLIPSDTRYISDILPTYCDIFLLGCIWSLGIWFNFIVVEIESWNPS